MGILNSNILKKVKADFIVTDIDSLTNKELKYIKDNIVEISKGRDSGFTIKTIAQKLFNYFDGRDVRHVNGAIAEFFLICILREHGFSQEFCFKNLEENSAKKGFDGLFLKNNEIWNAESKSSSASNTHKFSHENTLNKGYSALKSSLGGEAANDPWENAFNHATIAKSSKKLIQKLTLLSERFTKKDFFTIDRCNIILGSTVIEDNINLIEKDISAIEAYLSNHTCQNEFIVVINLKTSQLFIEAIAELANE